MFGGYPSFTRTPRLLGLARAAAAPERIGAMCERVAAPVLSALGWNPKFASALRYGGDVESAYFLQRCLHLTRELEQLLDQSWRDAGLERLGLLAPRTRRDNQPLHAAIALLELTRYMRNQPLRDADWASMAHSLEVRVPFLDLPLFERVAPALASYAPPSKRDLARASGSLALAAAARRKTGFTTPVGAWLQRPAGGANRRGDLRDWAMRVGAAFRALPPRICAGPA